MKKLIRSNANTVSQLASIKIIAASDSSAVFSPENVAEMLSQLPQMSRYNIGLDYSPEGIPQFTIGDITYDCHWA